MDGVIVRGRCHEYPLLQWGKGKIIHGEYMAPVGEERF